MVACIGFQILDRFATCIHFIAVGGVYWVSCEMFKPYCGYVQINMKSFFVEMENGWARWDKYNSTYVEDLAFCPSISTEYSPV